MERRQLTPTRTPHKYGSVATATHSPDRLLNTFEVSFIKEFEALRIQARSLEAQNKLLSAEVDKLRQEKQHGDNRFIEKITFEEETLLQYQKDKNYQLELMRLKCDEDMNRMRRDKDRQLEGLLKELRLKDIENRERSERLNYLELKNAELSKALALLERELMTTRETTLQLNEKFTRVQTSEKLAMAKVSELEADKQEMEREIHLLLQVDCEKSGLLAAVEARAATAENNERSLHDKIKFLSEGIIKLQENIASTKDKLALRDNELREMERFVEGSRKELSIKDSELKLLSESISTYKTECQESMRRQRIREKEALELITANQRLFGECNILRHRVHDLAITYNFPI